MTFDTPSEASPALAGFALAVVLTLGLGIGANTAIFSVVRGVMLRPLPHKDGDRLMYLRQSADGPGRDNIAFSVPEINDFRDRVEDARPASPSTRRSRSPSSASTMRCASTSAS